jgi:hypothetical protein
MMIVSVDLATLSAQLGQLSEEELHALLSNHSSETTIASTPADTVPRPTSVRAHATHMPLPNISVGGSLLAMASSHCRQSAIPTISPAVPTIRAATHPVAHPNVPPSIISLETHHQNGPRYSC